MFSVSILGGGFALSFLLGLCNVVMLHNLY